jgi:hypothetical protein
MPSRDQLKSEEQTTLDRDESPSDEWPPEFGPEYWESFRQIGLLQVALTDLLSDAANLAFGLRDSAATLDLSPAAFFKVFARAIPPEIRDSPRHAAILAGLTAWFADLGAEIVDYRKPRLEPARAYQRLREESERARIEREENIARRKAEEARQWAQHEADHEKFLAFKKSQQQQVR